MDLRDFDSMQRLNSGGSRLHALAFVSAAGAAAGTILGADYPDPARFPRGPGDGGPRSMLLVRTMDAMCDSCSNLAAETHTPSPHQKHGTRHPGSLPLRWTSPRSSLHAEVFLFHEIFVHEANDEGFAAYGVGDVLA